MTGANLPPAIAAPAMKKPGRGLWLIAAGGLLTVVWLGLLVTFAYLRWDKIVLLDPNSAGDFLAGAFAPLAFLWLVLGFFQQGIELRNSGQALWLQGEELRNSVEQQKALVLTTREQLEFDRDVVTQQRFETLRRAQPAFKLNYDGVVSADGANTCQRFKLTNIGKDCFDLSCVVDAAGSSSIAYPGTYNKDVLANGTTVRWDFWIENAFDGELVATVSYRDGLNNDQVKRFSIRVMAESFLIGEKPQDLVES